jgi:1-acyl-sn-glycerol-3-phosphate acyltransferase
MVVGNHSAYGIMEIFVLLCAWTRRFGTARPVVGLAHDVGLKWPLRWGVERIGGMRASPEAAQNTLSRGFDLLVFPGGDVDALRPFSARYEVHWSGRSGFVQVAASTGASIVPLANCGSHAQYSLLPGGSRIAHLLRLRRYRIYRWPLPLGSIALIGTALASALGWLSPWWVALGFLCAFFPNPSRMEIRFLEPIDPLRLIADSKEDEKAAAEVVRSRIEAALRGLAAGRKTPWG